MLLRDVGQVSVRSPGASARYKQGGHMWARRRGHAPLTAPRHTVTPPPCCVHGPARKIRLQRSAAFGNTLYFVCIVHFIPTVALKGFTAY